jgi:hypothetical protein
MDEQFEFKFGTPIICSEELIKAEEARIAAGEFDFGRSANEIEARDAGAGGASALSSPTKQQQQRQRGAAAVEVDRKTSNPGGLFGGIM